MYEKMLAERQLLSSKKKQVVKRMAKLPEGSFKCYHEGPYEKWYVFARPDGYTKQKKTYVSHKNVALAEKHAQRTYLELQLDDINHELDLINHYIKNHRQESLADKYLNSDSVYSDLIRPMLELEGQELLKWTINYKKLDFNSDQLKFKALDGNYYRSKSESIIATRLYEHHIPYRYESPLRLRNGRIVYPDFTIKHPRTEELLVWEHFGLMNNAKYVEDNVRKLVDYILNGLVLTENLIITVEHNDSFLVIERIERIIKQYFL